MSLYWKWALGPWNPGLFTSMRFNIWQSYTEMATVFTDSPHTNYGGFSQHTILLLRLVGSVLKYSRASCPVLHHYIEPGAGAEVLEEAYTDSCKHPPAV